MISVLRLFISPGHNFFGHHGRPGGEHPIIEVDEIECEAGRGIRNDRFFDYKPDYKGQITFFSADVFHQLRDALRLPDADASLARRNAIVSGVDLNTLIGARFEIQGVIFEGTEECRPCYWMDRAFAPGAEELLKGRGGLRARILRSGWLRVER